MPILLAGAFALAGPNAVLKPDVHVAGPELRIGDLVEAQGFALPAEIASRIVAKVPRSADLPATTLAAWVRRRVPGLSIEPPANGAIVRITVRAVPPARRPTNCFETARSVDAGRALTRRDVAAVPCRSGSRPALVYDADSATLSSARTLPAAAYLGQLPQLPATHVTKGRSLTLRSAAGPVVIERSVTALQGASVARRIFVRDDSGKVFAVPLAIDPEAGQ